MMSCPGGVFHCSLGLMGEGNEPRYVCVCVFVRRPTVYDGVFTRGPVLWCCDAECHPAPAWALQPEKPAVKLTGLSSALTYTLSLPAHTHTHARTDTHTHTHTHTYSCNRIHIMRHTHAQTHNSLMAWGLSTHAHTSPPTSTHIHRPSHKLQAVSLMPATNTVQKEYAYRAPIYIVATHNLSTFSQFDENQQWDWIGMWNIMFRLCFHFDSLPECSSIFIQIALLSCK